MVAQAFRQHPCSSHLRKHHTPLQHMTLLQQHQIAKLSAQQAHLAQDHLLAAAQLQALHCRV